MALGKPGGYSSRKRGVQKVPLPMWERPFFGVTAASRASRPARVGSNQKFCLDKHREGQHCSSD